MNSKQQNNQIKIDASKQVLGRLASDVAEKLQAKRSVNFAYNKVPNVKVVVYNAKDIIVTGKKKEQKKYYKHTGYLGNLKEITLEKLLKKNPSKVIELAVRGMLPKNRLQKEFLKNLTVLDGELNAK